MPSLVRQAQEVREALEGPARYQDLALALRRAKTGETLLWAGGLWDRLERRFVDDATPTDVVSIYLEESQVEFTRWFERFLGDFREGYPRDISLALVAGDRRGGKSFNVYFCQIAALIDVPKLASGLPSVGWTVSKTYRERDELDQLILGYLPKEFYRHQRAPEHRFTFANGGVLRNLSADDPDSLKQGRVDWLLYNEPQKMMARGIVNGLYGTADQGGLCMMAANRPRAGDSRGEWLYDLKEAIDDEIKTQAEAHGRAPLGAVYFNFSSKQNTKIDQPARKRVGRLAGIIDPATAEADNDDAVDWKRPGERACWEFDKRRHLRPAPQVGLVDCTREILQRHAWGDWDAAGGLDCQSKPHIPTAVLKCFGDPEKPLYCFVDEHVEVGRSLTEEQFLDGFAEAHGDRYRKENLLWIIDNSSIWQGPKHDFDGGERPSGDVLEGYGWTVIGAQAPAPNSKTGRGRNPRVDERLQLYNELLRQDRIWIDPKRCPWLIECHREALTKRDTGRRRLVGNLYAHMIDAATYPIWRLERRPSGFRPGPGDVRIVKLNRR